MSLVRLHTVGAETKAEALELGGVDIRSCHPITRYIDNPSHRVTRSPHPRPILRPKLARKLGALGGQIEFPRFSYQQYFRDLWNGYAHTVYALASDPTVHEDTPNLARLAVVAHALTEDQASSIGDSEINEVLLQQSIDGTWYTVAAVATTDDAKKQYGFVDPILFDEPFDVTEERLLAETDAYLSRLAETALSILPELAPMGLFAHR